MEISTDYYVDESKKFRIEHGIDDKWKPSGGRGTFVYPARFGKTFAGILLIRRVLKTYPTATILIGTKNAISRDQWDKQIRNEFPNNKVYVDTYNTICRYNTSPKDKLEFHLFIADEIHNLFSEEYINILKGKYFTHKFILGLTATPPNSLIELSKYAPIVDSISTEESISRGWLCDYTEYNVSLELDKEDKERYTEFTKILRETITLFKGMAYRVDGISSKYLFKDDYDAIMSCYSGKRTRDTFGAPLYIASYDCRSRVASAMGWHVNLDMRQEFNRDRDEYWNPSSIEDRVRIFANIQNKRNELLSSSIVKLNAVVDIYKKLQQPCICFNDNIPFAELVASSINKISNNAIAYHSKVVGTSLINYDTGQYITTAKGDIKTFGMKGVRKYIIENFGKGNLDFISAVEALDESLDIQTISLVICTTGTINPIQYKQRISRGNTINPNAMDKEAVIFNLYFDDFYIKNDKGEELLVKSRDKTKLLLRQKDSYNVKWIKLEDI